MKRVMMISILGLLLTSICFGGTTGRISGQVIDAKTGIPVEMANVLLMGTNYGATTNKDGLFLMKDVSPGIYIINVLANNYHLNKMKDIRIKVDKTTTINFSLQSISNGNGVSNSTSIVGVVFDEKTKRPIEGARIISGNNGTESDVKGGFKLGEIQSKVISVKVLADGYITKLYSDLVISSDRKNKYEFFLSPQPVFNTETFYFNYISGRQASELISITMGKNVEIISGNDNSFTIRDSQENLEKIRDQLKGLDIPPKQIWLEVRLLLASPHIEGKDLPPELSHIKKQLTSLFKYKSYYVLDDAKIMAYQNQPCAFVVGQGGYEAQIKRVEYHNVQNGLIKLQQFNLKSEQNGKSVLHTSVNINNGNTVILGASNVDASGQALITVVTAKVIVYHDGVIKTKFDGKLF